MAVRKKKRDQTKKIGKRLRELREHRGLSQSELSRRTGVAQNVISEYEAGNARMHAAVFAQLTAALDGNADELLGLQEIKPRKPPPKVFSQRIQRRAELIDALPEFTKRQVLRAIDLMLKGADTEKKQ